MRFEWDEAKNRQNQRKHGVTFEVVRIISARPATRREADWFGERMGDLL